MHCRQTGVLHEIGVEAEGIVEISERILHPGGLGMVSDGGLMIQDSQHLDNLDLLWQRHGVGCVVETLDERDKAASVHDRYKAPHDSQENVGEFQSVLLGGQLQLVLENPLVLVDGSKHRAYREVEVVHIGLVSVAHDVALEIAAVHDAPLKDVGFGALDRSLVNGAMDVGGGPAEVLGARSISAEGWLAIGVWA